MLTTNQKGAIAEAKIAAAATELRIEVYHPVFKGERFNIIFAFERELMRVQCKWARRLGDVVAVDLQTSRRVAGGHLHRSYTSDEIDAVAAYSAALDQCWLLPAARVVGRREISLRLAPSRNNQELRVNWAVDYELGAIAQLGERVTGSHEAAGSSPASSIA